MRRGLRIYLRYIRISFSTAAAYRANFFFTQCIALLSRLLVPLVTVLIYAGGQRIPGWSFEEALLIQSVFMLCTGACAPLFNNIIWVTMSRVREGTYDMVLLKPCSAMFLTVAEAFDIEYLGTLVGGIAMFGYAVSRMPAQPELGGWLLFALLLLMGMCMTLGCLLLMSSAMFRWVGNSRMYEIFDAVTTFGRYPGTIFSRLLGGLSTYIIPVAMMGYIPAASLLGRASPSLLVACLPCALFLLLGVAVFRRMTYLYQSAGG